MLKIPLEPLGSLDGGPGTLWIRIAVTSSPSLSQFFPLTYLTYYALLGQP